MGSNDTRIILITGANTGLGLETVKALFQSSKNEYTILLGGRSIDKAKAAAEQVRNEFSPKSKGTIIEPVQIDIEDDESIENLVRHISETHGRLDILLNNAGVQLDALYASGKLSMREMWNQSWNVNTTSTNILIFKLVPLLLKSNEPRIACITSGTSTLAEHESQKLPIDKPAGRGWPKPTFMIPAYRSSKTGMNMMMREWTRLLKEDGVKVLCISPGQLATGLGPGSEANKKAGAIDPAIGGQFVKEVVEGEHDEALGKVARRDGIQPW